MRASNRVGLALLVPLLSAQVALLWTGRPAGASGTTASRFGVVQAFEAPDQARAARVGWERVMFLWHGLQPSSASDWYPPFPDDVLARSIGDGREVVGLLIGTPHWASDGGRTIDVPRGLYLPPDDPGNVWARFVQRIVSSYKGRIRTWVIWNEPDIWDADHSGSQWAGSVADYYQLLKTAYVVAKGVDPDVRVATAGLTFWWDATYGREPYLQRLLAVAEADATAPAHNWYFDVVVLQLYNDPLGLYDVPLKMRRILADRGLQQPIWINETNVAPWDDPAAPLPRSHFRGTMDEQASFVVEAAAAALAAGVERVEFYKMRDSSVYVSGSEQFGLIRADGSARPAYDALRVVTRYFDGAQRASLRRAGPLVEVTLERPGEQVTVVWNLSPSALDARVPAVAAQAVQVDKQGRETPLSAGPDGYVLRLPPATHNTAPGEPGRYLTGGGPLLLAQAVGRLGSPAPAAPALPGGALPGEDALQSWVAPTGHAVSGDWLAFLRANGDVDSQGYPRGPVHVDPNTGQVIQCFQRAVLEWHPEGAPGDRIQRRLLGDILYPGADPPLSPTDAPPGPHSYFPFSPDRPIGLGHFVANLTRTGQAVYFKDFFDGRGKVAAFGYPKEEPKLRDGRWTQRFQAAVFEYHPEFDRDGLIPGTSTPYRHYRVQLELLGERYARESRACGQ